MSEETHKPVVLLVDDDLSILFMYGDYLRAKGFEVVVSRDGEEAISEIIARDGKPGRIEIVVTDVMMARVDGWALLDFIRNQLRLDEVKMPVIVMSAVESIDLEMEYMRHRANDWVTKPIKPLALLVQKIRPLLGMVSEQGGGTGD